MPFFHADLADLTVVTACLGASGWCTASPGGSEPGQPLLGVKTVRGTADRRRLPVLRLLLRLLEGAPDQLPQHLLQISLFRHKAVRGACRGTRYPPG